MIQIARSDARENQDLPLSEYIYILTDLQKEYIISDWMTRSSNASRWDNYWSQGLV